MKADAAVDELEAVESNLLTRGRSIFGVSGRLEFGRLRDALGAAHLTVQPAIAIGAAGAIAMLPFSAVWLLRDEMSHSFGGYGTLLELLVAATCAAGVVAGPLLAGRAHERTRLAAGMTLAIGIAVTVSALSSLYGLLLLLALSSLAGGAAHVLVLPLLWDLYPPEVRGRVVGIYAGGLIGLLCATTGLFAVATTAGLSWRVVLLVLGIASCAVSAAIARIPDPRRGAWDLELLAREAHDVEGGLGQGDVAAPVGISLVEQYRRVLLTPTCPALLVATVAFGLFALPAQRYISILWRDQLGVAMITWHRLSAIAWLGGFAGVAYATRRVEIAYRASPARLVQLLSWLSALAAATIAILAVSTDRVVAMIVALAATASFAAVFACASFALLSLTHPSRRPHAAALLGVSFLAGAHFGTLLLDTIGTRFGASWGLLTGAGFMLSVARGVNRVLPDAPRQLDNVVTSIVEEESLRAIVSQGTHVPLLSCRGIDFSYGQLQVLFGVDFTVDDGEMVALLGTNGAGKSTLLRVISGLGLPTAGTVRFRGTDISYAGTDRRVQLGISQIPGGKAVFGPMTVAENLAVYGYSHGRDKVAVARGVDATFECFPRLNERRNQLASTLSGGEQQMLALGKAFILQPQLLLIDELSLGLAPIIVGDLLKMVRRINDGGTAVVLVEQSVNIALALVHHAYFMEKGQIRFDGRASELIERPDLVRSVFLEGVAAAVAERV